MSLSQQQALEQTYVMKTFGRKPVEFVRGSGMNLYDDEGKQYLDFLSGIGVISLGHCNPRIVAALQDQAAKLMHVSNYYYIENRGEVAQRLSDLLNAEVPENERQPWKCFFSNSGAESNECAIKLARLFAKRKISDDLTLTHDAPRMIVVLEKSFHGRTMETLAATAQPVKQEAFFPLSDGFLRVPANDCKALEALFAERGAEICAVMLEPIQGESGVNPCTEEFMQTVRRLTQEHGALMICDEVQTGMYRTGKAYGFQCLGVTPDIVSMAKGIGSGFPMGVCAARAEVADAFSPGDHGTTFGGSSLAIRVCNEVLNIFEEDNIGAHVKEVGAYLAERLAELDHVLEVRGYGLMRAVQFDEQVDAPGVVSRGLEEGLVLNATGPHTLRFLPPLICTKEEVDELMIRIRKCF